MKPEKEMQKLALSITALGKTFEGWADGESAMLAVFTAMSEPERAMGKRYRAIIKTRASALSARLWSGMLAYAKDNKVAGFFQRAQTFTRGTRRPPSC